MRKPKSKTTTSHVLLLLVILLCFDNILLAEITTKNSGKKKGYITIATIGSSPASVAANTEPQKVVEKM